MPKGGAQGGQPGSDTGLTDATFSSDKQQLPVQDGRLTREDGTAATVTHRTTPTP
jgi:hypothetical protein